jgi:hypothetical protein
MFKKTVEGVIAQFRKSVADLQQIEEQQRAEAGRIAEKIGGLQSDHSAAVAESVRAGKIAGNIEKLISA